LGDKHARGSVLNTGSVERRDKPGVIADGLVVGRIIKAAAVPEGSPWMWTLAFWAS
jgi:hypothetical protein